MTLPPRLETALSLEAARRAFGHPRRMGPLTEFDQFVMDVADGVDAQPKTPTPEPELPPNVVRLRPIPTGLE